jgi:hypothetical protein
VKKYVVELTGDERRNLYRLISAGRAPARMLNRARILLSRPTSASTPRESRSSTER